MKVAFLVVPLVAATPGVVQAQLEDLLPRIEAKVGPWTVSAGLGRNGVDLRVGERVGVSGRGGPVGGAATSATARRVLDTADDYVGTPYEWGGTTPSGFDCSGFVQYVFRRHGVELPRTSRQQAQVGQTAVGGLQAGDLMLFASNGGRIDHIAIYAGNNRIIHSSSSGGGVGYDDLSTQRGRWFAQRHVATRRVLAAGQSLVGELSAALRALDTFDPPDHAPRRH